MRLCAFVSMGNLFRPCLDYALGRHSILMQAFFGWAEYTRDIMSGSQQNWRARLNTEDLLRPNGTVSEKRRQHTMGKVLTFEHAKSTPQQGFGDKIAVAVGKSEVPAL